MHKNVNKLKRHKTLLLMGILISMIAANLIVLQSLLHKKNDDTIIINLIGRQLLYSQNITNYFFSIENGEYSFTKDIHKNFNSWKKTHFAFLNGDAEVGIHAMENLVLKAEMTKLTNNIFYIEKMINSNARIDQPTIKLILQNQYHYTERMNYVLNEFYLDSESRYRTINYIDSIFTFILIIAILLIFTLVYLPIEKEIDLTYKNHIKKLEEIAWDQSHLIRAPVANLLGLTRFLNKKSAAINDAELLKVLQLIEQEAMRIDHEVHAVVSKTIVSNDNQFSKL